MRIFLKLIFIIFLVFIPHLFKFSFNFIYSDFIRFLILDQQNYNILTHQQRVLALLTYRREMEYDNYHIL